MTMILYKIFIGVICYRTMWEKTRVKVNIEDVA